MYSYKLSQMVASPPQLEAAIVVPIFNEFENIAPLVERVSNVLEGFDFEIIFVDDGSTDGSPARVEEIAAVQRHVRLVRRIGRRGLASAVTEGFCSTIAPVVMVIDGDLQHDEAILPDLLAAVISDSADLAVGTRYTEGGSVGDWGKRRQVISRFATRLAGSVTKTRLSDPMSGYFAIRRDLFLAIAPRLSQRGYKLLLDIVASHPYPLRVAEVAYTFRLRTAGYSKLDGAVILEYGELLLDKLLGHILPARLIIFGAIGLIGTLVHLAMLWLSLAAADLSFTVAQALATLGAMTFNYTLNNALTYRDRMLKGARWLLGWLSFCAACSLGAIANVGISSLLFSGEWSWWFSGLAGAAIGSVWNYAATSWLTWRRA